MGITQVTAEYGKTINLQNYESERIHLGLVATVGPDDTPLGLLHDLFRQARDAADAEARDLAERRQRARMARYVTKPQVDEEDDPATGGL